MSGIVNSTGAVSGVVGTTVGTPAGGNTEADTWRINAAFQGDGAPITANWVRDDSDAEGLLGTGMTQSSGTFTFPSTGFWWVQWNAAWYFNGDSRNNFVQITVTENNSSYDQAAIGYGFIQQTNSNNTYNTATCSKIIDVISTTNVKVQFHANVDNNLAYCYAYGTSNVTYAVFIKLGAT